MNAHLAADDEAAALQEHPASAALFRLDEFLPYQINVLGSITSQAMARACGDRHDIGMPEWRVLVTLGQFGVMTGKAVGQQSHMHKTKVSRAVAMLEQRKLLMRRANRADLRESFLALTPLGREVYDDLVPLARRFADQLASAIDPADRAAFDRSVARLMECATRLNAGASEPAPD